MYRSEYAEVLADDPKLARARERRALQHAIGLLEDAERHGIHSRQAVEALSFVRQLWGLLLNDLAAAENDLPRKLKAELISIGVWVIRQTEALRLGRETKFDDLRDVLRTIAEGLR